MKKINYLHILLILFVYSLFVFFKQGDALKYRFNEELIPRYLRSQDIEDVEDRIDDRIFISDNDIYVSAGYLYAKGEDPTNYNFQHPPLIKYLYGFSLILFGNPFFVQFIFGFLLLVLTYFLGIKVFKNTIISLIASFLLLIDPLFSSLLSEALLDLGQAVFSLGFIVSGLFFPAGFAVQGILLGLLAASKFWTTTIFFVIFVYGYRLFIKKEKIGFDKFTTVFLVATLVFSLTYFKTFIDNGFLFNLPLYQLSVLKFMLDHNRANIVGAPLILFLTGYFTNWWNGNVIRENVWSILWPIAFINSIYLFIKSKKVNVEYLIYILPVIYVFYLSTQVPFSRYFILIIPYFYLGLSKTLIDLSRKLFRFKSL